MAELTNEQKKAWAKTLYTRETLTQAEIAERVGVSRGDCEQLDRQRKLGAAEGFHNHHTGGAAEEPVPAAGGTQQRHHGKPEGERFPNAAEADTISKLSNAIKKLETEVGLADIISVFSDLLKWVRTYDSMQAKEITPLLDAFVKSKLS